MYFGLYIVGKQTYNIMSNQGLGSEIQEECRKLQRTSDIVSASWSTEILAYESTSNKPNSLGVVADETLFPYHNALYALLDCFDGLGGTRNDEDSAIIPPSPAPLPSRNLNGNRRKKSAPTIDAHGVEIMELPFIEGHLPNSAWAIRNAIMPLERQEQFANDDESYNHYRENNHHEQQQQHQPVRQRHRTPRFWNILMDSRSEITRIASSDISLIPILDNGFGVDDDSDNWEDVDDSNSDVIVLVADTTTSPNGNLARNFTFLFRWEQTIISERRGVTSSMAVPQAKLPSYLYLKVLMHSLSELQREHRLARAVLLLMADCKFCSTDSSRASEDEESGLECLRRLLSVLSFGYTPCDGKNVC